MTSTYRLADEIHRLAEVDGEEKVITEQRWDAVRAATPRSQHLIIHNGTVVTRKNCRSQRSFLELAAHMKALRARLGDRVLDDSRARAEIVRITGDKPAEWCFGARGDCSAPMPVGAARCLDGHAAGRVGAGALSGVRRRGPILLDTRQGVSS